jgi:hypothetical protein
MNVLKNEAVGPEGKAWKRIQRRPWTVRECVGALIGRMKHDTQLSMEIKLRQWESMMEKMG